MTISFSEALLLGKMAEFTTHEEQPFSIAAQGIGLPPTADSCLGIWPFLLREDLELRCCEKELQYGRMVYCRLAHYWDSHEFKTMEEYCSVIQSIEPVTPWKNEAEKVQWLQEQVAVELKKEKIVTPQADGDEGDGA